MDPENATVTDNSTQANRKPVKKPATRKRDWAWTLNNYDDDDVEMIRQWNVVYTVFGREVAPETGTPHLQGYTYFATVKALSGLKKLHNRIHWEPAGGDSLHNYDYCTKCKDFEEYGTRPMTNREKGEAGKRKYEETLELAKEGRLDDVEAGMRIKYYRTLKQIATDYMKAPEDAKDVTGIWVVGPPNVGKSHCVREVFPDIFDKPANKWWDGYSGGPAMIDDFDKAHACLGHHLKRWADRYSFTAEIKGGTVSLRPSSIVVTSNYAPNEIWTFEGDRVLCEAITRRFLIVRMGAREEYDDVKRKILDHIRVATAVPE